MILINYEIGIKMGLAYYMCPPAAVFLLGKLIAHPIQLQGVETSPKRGYPYQHQQIHVPP
jgi:hypothetical protein